LNDQSNPRFDVALFDVALLDVALKARAAALLF